VYKPIHGNVLISIADSLTRMGAAAMETCGMVPACGSNENPSKFSFLGNNPTDYYYGWKQHEKLTLERFPRVKRFTPLFIANMDVRDVVRHYDFDGLREYIEMSEKFVADMAAGRYQGVGYDMRLVR